MSALFAKIAALTCAAAVLLAVAEPAEAGTWPERSVEDARHAHSWFQTNDIPVPEDDLPVQMVLVGGPPDGLTLAEVERAARHTAEQWSSVPCSFARIEYAGVRDSLEDLAEGEYPFVFADPEQVSCLGAQDIGWTSHVPCAGFPMETVFLNEVHFRWVTSPEPFQPANVDPDGEHGELLRVDLASVLTHEFGHVLGLAHSFDPLSTMYADYRRDGGMRDLAVDDKLGICSLYEVARATDECRSGRDCGPTESCRPLDGLRLCHEFRGQLGDACALDRLVCDEECVLPDDGERYGYCTTECGPGAGPCGQNFECVEDLVRPGERHCMRLGGPDDSGCSSSGAPSAPMPLWMVLVGVGVGLVRRKS